MRLGLVATVLLATSGFLAGRPNPHDLAWVAGVAVWYVGLVLLARAWWQLRAETDRGRLLRTAAIWSVPLLVAPPLGSHDVYAYACQGQLFNAGLDLYRVGPAALPCSWLDAVPPLWRATATPYGPLWIAIEGGVAAAAHGSLPVAVLLFRAVGLLGVLLCVAATHRLSGGNALLAASPLVLVHVVSGAHNDIVLAGLVLAGFAAARNGTTRAAVPAGLAFGLAAAIKITAVVAAPFAMLLFFGGTARAGLSRTAAFTAAGVGAYAGLAAITGHGLGFVHALGATSGMVQWLSVPTGVGMAAGYVLRLAGEPESFGTAVAVARAAGLVALAAVLAGLWWRVRRGARDAVLRAAGCGLLAAAALGPVFYAWYAIAGLAVLSATDLPDRLRGVVHVAAVALPAITLPDSLGLATKTKVPGALLDVALVAAAAWWALSRRRPSVPTPPARPSAPPRPGRPGRRLRRSAPSSAAR